MTKKKEKIVGIIYCVNDIIKTITDIEVQTWLDSFTNEEWAKMLIDEQEKYLKQKKEQNDASK